MNITISVGRAAHLYAVDGTARSGKPDPRSRGSSGVARQREEKRATEGRKS
jgi:hypothetical protein